MRVAFHEVIWVLPRLPTERILLNSLPRKVVVVARLLPLGRCLLNQRCDGVDLFARTLRHHCIATATPKLGRRVLVLLVHGL